MAITAALVKELRERTGSGMMECKKALVEADGDVDAAIEAMRKAGQAKAVKKAGRVAAEGVIIVKTSSDKKQAIMLEINSETDFVARDDNFTQFANAVAEAALANKIDNVEALSQLAIDGKSVDELRAELIAKIGENITLRRVVFIESDQPLGAYTHGIRIGSLVLAEGGDEELARDVAMHVAASKPEVISGDEVDQNRLQAEKDVFVAQAKDSGKPDDIIEKMVVGRLKKFVNEISLLGQPFVKQPDLTVEKLLKGKNASVKAFYRYEVGEGIEKKEENFRDEVMAQVKGS